MERQPCLFLAGLKLLSSSPDTDTLGLQFDDGSLAVFNPVSFSGFEGLPSASEAAQALSGCIVLDAYFDKSQLSLDFGGIYLHISLKDEDYSGPEAACWHGKDGKIIVIN